ncbi:MAG: DNA repair protein RecN [Nitrospirae bacterium]|nr:MAG: DNA repair protein RecN [Nitrospirota bacterium]
MLTELRIRNFAIIEEIALEFSEGFTVLTGETGAGKSILVDALDLLIGGRGNTELIRTGAEEAEVSGVFVLDAKGPVAAFLREQDLLHADETELIVRRILSRTGRHRIHVNGRPGPLTVLQSLRGLLVDIHGQHDQQSLFKPSVQLALLDEFGGLLDLRNRYQAAFQALRDLEAHLTERQRSGEERRAQEDLVRYQADEISSAHLQPNEDQTLERERLLLSQGRRLAELLQAVYGPLYEDEQSLLGGLRALVPFLKELSGIDAELSGDRDRFEQAHVELTDLAERLRQYRDRLEFDTDRLEAIEERLDLVRKLTKKYGGSVETTMRSGEEAAGVLRDLERWEEDIAALSSEVAAARENALKMAQGLSKKRRAAAGDLEKRLERELAALHMNRARVNIALEQKEATEGPSLGPTGVDVIEFKFSANLGEPPQPLARIASGGELSRVMLSLKTVLAKVDPVPVMVFDEVDAGIGGAVSETVGKRLRELTRHGHQVFCITHLAPIAAHAQQHFAVTKITKHGRTVTKVEVLNAGSRVEEVARMLGGVTITPKMRDTAAEMMKSAQR